MGMEWFEDISNQRLRRVYENDVKEFIILNGIGSPESFQLITRQHILNWKNQMEQSRIDQMSIRRKMKALSMVFDWLIKNEYVKHNPAKSVK